METNKILTVAVPTYNMERYLGRCLDSLILPKELMERLEVLVVNDGSKDKSSQIAHEYENRFPLTFRVIDKQNGNYGSCVNRALDEAKGKYIKILDADDWFDNESFETYLKAILSLDVDLILNDVIYINTDNIILNSDKLSLPQNTRFKMFDYKVFPEMHNVAYRTENLRKMGYRQLEGISYTDQQWMFEPMSSVRETYYVPTSLYMYLNGREGQTMNHSIMLKNISHLTAILLSMFSFYDNHKYIKEATSWLNERLKMRTNKLYWKIIVENRDEQNKQLIEFDENIKVSHPSLYEESYDWIILSDKIPYKYARYWRKNHKLNHVNLIIASYFFLKGIKHAMLK